MKSSNVKIVLCMIVRNEAHCITKCFDSLLGTIDAIAVVDTGSTDNTPEVIRNYMKEKNIHGSVICKRWKQFAISRNDSLEHASYVIRQYHGIEPTGPLSKSEYDKLSKANWKILTTDADNIFLNIDEECYTKEMALKGKYKTVNLKDFMKPADCYMIRMRSGKYTYYIHMGITPFIVTGARGYRYYCPIHEYIDTKGWTPKIETIENVYCYSGRHGGRSMARSKGDRDAAALAEAVKECRVDPLDYDRCVYYMAQSYRDAGQFDIAYNNFLKRGEMATGYYEERYYSYIQAAIVLPYTSYAKYLTKDLIELMQMDLWYKAHEICPHRREALYDIMCFCDKKKMFRKAYDSVIRWVDENDVNKYSLFVDATLYGWKFDEKVALICYYAGEHNDFKKYLERAIKDPNQDEGNRARLMEHRQFYR